MPKRRKKNKVINSAFPTHAEPRTRNREEVVRNEPISISMIEAMLQILIRNEAAFLQVNSLMSAKELRDVGNPHTVLWRTVQKYWKKNAKLPLKEFLVNDIQSLVNANRDLLDEDELDHLSGIIEGAYDSELFSVDISASKEHAKFAIQTAQTFLHENQAKKVSEAAYDGTLPGSLPKLLEEELRRSREIETLTDGRSTLPFGEGWDKIPKPVLQPTNVAVFDRFLGGGQLDQEVYLFMAPYGSSKTTTAVQSICEGAKICRALEVSKRTKGGKKPFCIYATYETGREEFRVRCLSYLARIPFERLNNLQDFSLLRDSGEPLKYEKKIFAAKLRANQEIIPEKERIRLAVELMNEYVAFVDMTDSDEDPMVGIGGMEELARTIRTELRKRNDSYVHVVWVDHISDMADAENDANNGDMQGLTLILRKCVRQARDKIAKSFDTKVWLLHQLDGQANKKGSTAKLGNADAEFCKSIAKNANFAFVATKPTEDKRQLCIFRMSKHRRRPPIKEAVVRVNGRFCRIEDASDKFALDTNRHQFVQKSDLEMITGKPKELAKNAKDTSGTLI